MEEFGDQIEWSCLNCPKKRWEDLGDYTKKLLRLRLMRRGGYPFAANDLEYDEWIDLGRLEQCLATPVF